MTNLPLFRAKKIDSDEYVCVFLYQDIIEYIKSDGLKPDKYKNALDEESWYIMDSLSNTDMIDKSTLAIHFPDMLDSQGNKIFASLSEDGKGGDIARMESEYENYVAEFTSEGLSFYEYLDNKKYKNSSYYKVLSMRQIKVIGIQE